MQRSWWAPDGLAPEREAGAGAGTGLWTALAAARVVAGVTTGGAALRDLPAERLLDAWTTTVEVFRDPESAERQALDPALAATSRLSRAGLDAGLEAVLGGVAGAAAAELVREGRRRSTTGPSPPVLVVLAGNLPGLAVQPLLPALALGRSVVLKSSTGEPFFAPAFVAALAGREAAVGAAVAALGWPGGDRDVEAPLLAVCDPVLAYGESSTIADLERRATGRVVAYGPKTSLAVVGRDADPAAVAAGLARDVALFDQRGCLSIAAAYSEGEELAEALAEALAAELARLADRWPPGPALASEAAAVRHARDEALMAGARLFPLDPAAGAVVLDPRPAFRPTPGRRTVRVHPVADLASLPALLAPWTGRLQGAVLAGLGGQRETALRSALAALGISRFAAPGRLQHPDVRWHNGGIDPFTML